MFAVATNSGFAMYCEAYDDEANALHKAIKGESIFLRGDIELRPWKASLHALVLKVQPRGFRFLGQARRNAPMTLRFAAKGNLGKFAPSLKQVNANFVANFDLALSNILLDPSGMERPASQTLWSKVSVWGQLAVSCNRNLAPGDPVEVKGSTINISTYRDRSYLTLNADAVETLSNRIGKLVDEILMPVKPNPQDSQSEEILERKKAAAMPCGRSSESDAA